MLKTSHPKVTFLFFLVGIIFFIGSCKEKDNVDPNVPVACFDAPESTMTGVEVQFNADCSKNAGSFYWEFGDGTISRDQNPIHIYKVSGQMTVKLTVMKDSLESVTDKIIQVDINPDACIEHYNETITTAQVWKTGETHCILNGGLYIQDGGSLTIEPGVIVKMDKFGSIEVGYTGDSSSLIAIGTPGQPIVFTSVNETKAPGDWRTIGFHANASSKNALKHCVIEYGGSEVYSSFNDPEPMVRVKDGGKVSIENCTLSNGLTYALLVEYDGILKSFRSNDISNMGDYAIAVSSVQVHRLGPDNNIVNKGVLINESMAISDSVTWLKQSCPYYLQSLYIGSTEGSTLTLEPGVELRFLMNGSVTVGSVSSGTLGRLIAIGSPAEKIIFRSAEAAPSAGDWGGIYFSKRALKGSKLSNVIVQDAKGNMIDNGAITVSNSNIAIDSVEITNFTGSGVAAGNTWESPVVGFTSFSYNNITSTDGYPIIIRATHLGTIGEGNIISGPNPVLVPGGTIMGKDNVIKKLGVPYLVTDKIIVNNPSVADTTFLTIEPGVEMQFNTSWGLTLFNSNPGVFTAVGTAEEPIIFTSGKPDGTKAPGDWGGIEFYNRSIPGSKMDYCQVSYGGGRYANISINGVVTGEPVISNCQISNSASYGVYVFEAAPSLINLTYSNNTSADLQGM